MLHVEKDVGKGDGNANALLMEWLASVEDKHNTLLFVQIPDSGICTTVVCELESDLQAKSLTLSLYIVPLAASYGFCTEQAGRLMRLITNSSRIKPMVRNDSRLTQTFDN